MTLVDAQEWSACEVMGRSFAEWTGYVILTPQCVGHASECCLF